MNSTSGKFIYLHPLSLKVELKALAFFLLAIFIFRYRAISNIETHILGGVAGDGGLYWWLFNHNIENYFKLPFFNTLGFYPYSLSLAWSDNFILPAVTAMPFDKLISRTVLYNLILLLSTFLNGYLTYLLTYRLSGYFAAALLSGLALMTYPFFSAHLGHPQLQFFFWIPFSLLFFFKFLSSPKIIAAFLCGLTVFLSFLTSVYYTIFLLILLKLLFAGIIIQKPAYLKKKDYFKLIAGFGLGFILIIPFLFPYFAVKDTFGERFLYEAAAFKADILSYLSAPQFNWLYKSSAILSHNEAQLFGGFIILAFLLTAFYRAFGDKHFKVLATYFLFFLFAGAILSYKNFKLPAASGICLYAAVIVSICLLRTLGKYELKLGYRILTNRGIIGAALFAALMFFFFSLGPLNNFGIYTLYYYIFPGAEAIRAVGRAGALVYFLTCLTIPLTYHFLNKSGFLNKKIIFLLFIFIPAENWTSPYPLEEVPGTTPVLKYLEKQSAKNGVIITLPFSAEPDSKWGVKSWGAFATLNTEALIKTLSTEMHSVNGYSGQRSRLMYTLPQKLQYFPDRDSIEALSHISNLRYVLINSNKISGFITSDFFSKAAAFKESLSHLLSDSDGYHLFEFHPLNKIEKDFEIWMPSYPAGGKARLQLYFDTCEQNEIEVPIFMKKHFEQTPYAKLTLKKEIGWESKEIILPENLDKVAPAILILKPLPNCNLYLKDRSYLLTQNK